MTDTTDLQPDAGTTPDAAQDTAATGARTRRRATSAGTGLAALVLPELQALAGQLGISGVGRLRKSQLIEAIEARQPRGAGESAPAVDAPAAPAADSSTTDSSATGSGTTGSGPTSGSPSSSPDSEAPAAVAPAPQSAVDLAVDAALDGAADTAPAAPARRSRRASAPAGAPAPERTEAPDARGTAADAGPSVAARPSEDQDGEQQDGSRRSDPQAGGDDEQQDGEGGERMSRADRARERFLEREARRAERAARGENADGSPVRGDGQDRDDRDERDGADRDGQRRDRQARDGQDRDRQARDGQDRDRQGRDGQDRDERDGQDRDAQRRDRQARDGQERDRQGRDGQARDGQDRDRQDRDRQDRDRQDRDRQRPENDRQRPDRDRQGPEQGGPEDDDEFGPGRRGRFRERGRRRGRDRFGAPDGDPVVTEDDVLVPVAGILDVLENYGFVRTTGYLTGPSDVYVSMQQMKRYGLRRGDAVTGAVRQQREGERRDKFNALVRLDTVNGMDPEEARKRPEFGKLTPLYPQDRLRLETDAQTMTTRVIDLVMPVGKGQRALIVSPPKAGKTMVLQAIANAITTNNPECHLMVVLVDERPEEVTDMQRSVKGEVIASTFDRPPQDHITVAELSIERAKRLVELGHDVVVLLDSITRLGRAYNLGAPASGRVLTGGVDSAALYPPKRFLGAARNIENGGSLTIFATALVETGSAMDTVIFEEFKGTGNAELKLDRRLADRRMFPAIDVDASGTRKEELLLAPEELRIVHQLRRVLHALDSGARLELLLDKMKSTRTNVEFLMQIQKTTVNQDLAKG